ncbi:hypothetical protein D3C84_866060 [compost metagenome]
MGFYIDGIGEAVISFQDDEFRIDSSTLSQGEVIQTSQQAYDEDDTDFETSFSSTAEGESTKAKRVFTWKVEFTQEFSSGQLSINATQCVTPGVDMMKDLAFSVAAEDEQP